LSLKSPPSSSSLISLKLKKTFIFSHIFPLFRAIVLKTRSLVYHILDEMEILRFAGKNNKQEKLIFGSFRLYYNWSSSYRNPRGNSMDFDSMQAADDLEKYLERISGGDDGEQCHEIDRMAESFIAKCHEKFRLEKQESYRRFQEMLAGSV
ncbi:hypothetical protein M569_12057, partial [Genlisea aurea]